MANRETAPAALFHVRLRPLYCKQLRASLLGLSGWALAYISLSPQRNLCGWQHWSGHCLFRESQSVSRTFFFSCVLLSFHPSPFLEALFSSPLLFLSVAPTERTETDTPPHQRFVCQYGQLWSYTKAHRRCPHTAIPPKHVHQRVSSSPPFSVISYLLTLVLTAFLWRLFVMHSRCSVEVGRFKSRTAAVEWSRSDENRRFDLVSDIFTFCDASWLYEQSPQLKMSQKMKSRSNSGDLECED